jgi:hypothetical protein
MPKELLHLADIHPRTQEQFTGFCQNSPQQKADAEMVSLVVLFYAAKEISSTRVRAVYRSRR